MWLAVRILQPSSSWHWAAEGWRRRRRRRRRRSCCNLLLEICTGACLPACMQAYSTGQVVTLVQNWRSKQASKRASKEELICTIVMQGRLQASYLATMVRSRQCCCCYYICIWLMYKEIVHLLGPCVPPQHAVADRTRSSSSSSSCFFEVQLWQKEIVARVISKRIWYCESTDLIYCCWWWRREDVV